MTIASTLSIKAITEGIGARLKIMGSHPVVEVAGIVQQFNWLEPFEMVVPVGLHPVTVYLKRKESESSHASVDLNFAPGETVELLAVLEGTEAFDLRVGDGAYSASETLAGGDDLQAGFASFPSGEMSEIEDVDIAEDAPDPDTEDAWASEEFKGADSVSEADPDA